MYDFTTLRPRLGIGATKWGAMERAGVTDPEVIPFSVADMDLMTAPEIVEAVKQAAEFGVYGYTVMDERCRAALTGWMARRHGWEIDPEWIVNAFGVVHAVGQAVQAFTEPGDGVVYQTPAYPPFRRILDGTGRKALVNPLLCREGRYELDFQGLEALCARPEAKLLLFCSPHNPTGRVWTLEELRRVADICNRNGVLIFSDEVHFDFVYPPHRHTVMATLDRETAGNCIIGTSATKSFNLAGLSTASILIPNPELRRRFTDKTDGYTGIFTGYFGLAATRAAYEQGGPWLDELLVHIQGNYDYAKTFLAQKFPSVTVAPLEGTYLMWCDFSSLGLTPEEQERFMQQEANLWLNGGYQFGREGEGWERLVLACPRRPLASALERLDAAAARRGLPR